MSLDTKSQESWIDRSKIALLTVRGGIIKVAIAVLAICNFCPQVRRNGESPPLYPGYVSFPIMVHLQETARQAYPNRGCDANADLASD
jgi:hypothetical protein